MSSPADTWQASDVTDLLQRRGYQRIAASVDAKLWYLSPKSSTTAEQYVALEYKKTFRIYGAYIGFSSEDIRRVRNRLAAGVLSGLVKSLDAESRCWSIFDVGRALNWPLLGIPYPKERSAGSTQFAQMSDYLNTVLEPIDEPSAMLDRLVSFETPFDWVALTAHPMRRAVEAVATARVSGHDISDVHRKLLKAQECIFKEQRLGWPDFIARVCNYPI